MDANEDIAEPFLAQPRRHKRVQLAAKICLLLAFTTTFFVIMDLPSGLWRNSNGFGRESLRKRHQGQQLLAAGKPSQCSAYEICYGLEGDCCPSMSGYMLDCCSGPLRKSWAPTLPTSTKTPPTTSPQRGQSDNVERLVSRRVIGNDQFVAKHIGVAGLGLTYEVYDERFYRLFPRGVLPEVSEPFHSEGFAFAHEGPVYLRATNELFVVSNRMKGNTVLPANDLEDKTNQSVRMFRMSLDNGSLHQIESSIIMANGATMNCSSGDILVLSQGMGDWRKPDNNFTPSSIHRLDPYTGKSSVLLNNVYGLPFNSLNDIAMTTDGTVWMTDPVYGHQQGFLEGRPALPNAMWSLSPKDAGPRLIEMRTESRPNGLAVSPDMDTLYCTDSGYSLGDKQSRTVWSFKIEGMATGTPTLRAPKPLYYAEDGIPDGIKTDSFGNVYIGQGNGVAVVSSRGLLLGRILAPVGSPITQLVFAGPGYDQLVLLSEKHVWIVKMAVQAAYQLQC